MKYRISSKAQADLINIWKFTFDSWSIDQTDRYYNLIIDKIQEICEKPDIGRRYDDVRKNYWGVNVKSILFSIKLAKRK
jgi:toxin ParE1/3/4